MEQKRTADIQRKTAETDIMLKLDLDGTGNAESNTPIHFLKPLVNPFEYIVYAI